MAPAVEAGDKKRGYEEEEGEEDVPEPALKRPTSLPPAPAVCLTMSLLVYAVARVFTSL